MLDLFWGGTPPALAEMAAASNACGDSIAGDYVILTGAGHD